MTTCSLGLSAEAHSAGEKAILETAVRLFSELGFEGVSMRTVAREAGVSKSNIYHHFESKEALYLAIIRSSAGPRSVSCEKVTRSSSMYRASRAEGVCTGTIWGTGRGVSKTAKIRFAASTPGRPA